MNIIDLGRVIERIAIVGFAGTSLVLGWRLFRVGIMTRQRAQIEGHGIKVNLEDVGPGVFFGLFGAVLLVVAAINNQEYLEQRVLIQGPLAAQADSTEPGRMPDGEVGSVQPLPGTVLGMIYQQRVFFLAGQNAEFQRYRENLLQAAQLLVDPTNAGLFEQFTTVPTASIAEAMDTLAVAVASGDSLSSRVSLRACQALNASFDMQQQIGESDDPVLQEFARLARPFDNLASLLRRDALGVMKLQSYESIKNAELMYLNEPGQELRNTIAEWHSAQLTID